MDETIYDNLPDENEQAFVVLEEHYKRILTDNIRGEESNYTIAIHRSNYMNSVVAAARSLDIHALSQFEIAAPDEENWTYYQQFEAAVNNILIQIQIRSSRRKRSYSVHLSPPEKQKISFYITQIRKEITESEVENSKKEAIFKKLTALQEEIDRDRTRFDIIADATRRVIGLAGEAEKDGIRPYLKYLLLMFGEVDAAKEAEQQRLPGPADRKQLEAPKPPKEKSKRPIFKDDDIPF